MVSKPAAVEARSRGRRGVVVAEGRSAAFVFYCLFVISFLLHITTRIPALGLIRLDMLLGGLAVLSSIFSKAPAARTKSELPKPTKWLVALITYIVFSTPFVEWPGSVLREGLEGFAKAIFFYLLTVATVTSVSRLRWFLFVLLTCQTLRVLEPMYLHITDGYWGDTTTMGWQVMDRLSGAPADTINPNGLAFVIVVTLPFLHFVAAQASRLGLLTYLALLPVFFYVLLLTGSRSGLIVLAVVLAQAAWVSKYRTMFTVAMVLGSIVGLGSLSGIQQERFESIISDDVRGASTFNGRIDALSEDFAVAMRRPLLGHGLGTSAEANAHGRGIYKLSHNLLTEILQEIGLVGLIFFSGFLWHTIRSCLVTLRVSKQETVPPILKNASQALLITMLSGLVFALASYGLSEFYWYLWAGLSVALTAMIDRLLSVAGVMPREHT